MKYGILFVYLLFSISLFSQSGDSVLVSSKFLIESAQRMQTLQKTSALQIEQIGALESQIENFQILESQTQSILKIREQELEMYKGLANRFIELPPVRKPRWHETREFNFIAGIVVGGLVIYSGAYIVSTIR